MILLDTGPLVALFDKRDAAHEACRQAMSEIEEPLSTTLPVITEALFLLNESATAQQACLTALVKGMAQIEHLGEKTFARAATLMQKYSDFPMDFADATLVAVAEHLKIKKVFTLNQRDFRLYHPKHIRHFHLLPENI